MNTKNHEKYFTIVAIALTGAACIKSATARENEICKVLAKEKEPVAFLLDPSGKMSKGPINFGRYGYKYTHTERYIIPTDYQMIISPAPIRIENCPGACILLKEVAPVCKNSKTYAISYAMTDSKLNATDRSWLPWKENEAVSIFEIGDPKDRDLRDLEYKFEMRMVGEIFDAEKPLSKK
ncbi:hypothetical protein [Pseudoduganella sp. HUAS MS19]